MLANEVTNRILEDCKSNQVIGITGIKKNVGKTTLLNALLPHYTSFCLGITSIGLDGEGKDLVDGKIKPKIWVKSGTIYATSERSLERCDTTTQILNILNCRTPLGRIIIVRALSSGYVELTGPSQGEDLKRVIEAMKQLHVERILVDGAINRLATFYNANVDALILVTGGYSTLIKVVEETEVILQKQYLEHADFLDISMTKNCFCQGDYRVIYDNDLHRTVYVKGALTETLYATLRASYDNKILDIVVGDGSKVFLNGRTLKQLLASSMVNIKVLNSIPILCVSYNRHADWAKSYTTDEIKKSFEHASMGVPVINLAEALI